MAGGLGIVLTSVETLPPEQAGSYRRIRLRLTLAAPWSALIRLLASVEQATPPMLIDAFDLQVSPGSEHPSGATLAANMTIWGFREADSPSGAQ